MSRHHILVACLNPTKGTLQCKLTWARHQAADLPLVSHRSFLRLSFLLQSTTSSASLVLLREDCLSVLRWSSGNPGPAAPVMASSGLMLTLSWWRNCPLPLHETHLVLDQLQIYNSSQQENEISLGGKEHESSVVSYHFFLSLMFS